MPYRKFLSRLWGGSISNKEIEPLKQVYRRFLDVFHWHGIEASQIPRVLPELKLSDLSSEANLLAVITPGIFDKTAELFGIRTEWLEGHDDTIYDYLWTEDDPRVLWDHVQKVSSMHDESRNFPLRIFVSDKRFDRNSGRVQYLVPVVMEPLFTLGEDTIYRYCVYRDGFPWGHSPSRIRLKVVARLVYKRFRLPVPVCQVAEDEMEALLDGCAVPGRLWQGSLLTSPSLEDYALSREESSIAKEVDELPLVLTYIAENGLDSVAQQIDNAESSSDEHLSVVAAEIFREWKDVARSIADELDAQDAACGAYSSLRDLSDRIAVAMRNRNLHGPRGPVSSGTVLREALQGKKWSRKRSG